LSLRTGDGPWPSRCKGSSAASTRGSSPAPRPSTARDSGPTCQRSARWPPASETWNGPRRGAGFSSCETCSRTAAALCTTGTASTSFRRPWGRSCARSRRVRAQVGPTGSASDGDW